MICFTKNCISILHSELVVTRFWAALLSWVSLSPMTSHSQLCWPCSLKVSWTKMNRFKVLHVRRWQEFRLIYSILWSSRLSVFIIIMFTEDSFGGNYPILGCDCWDGGDRFRQVPAEESSTPLLCYCNSGQISWKWRDEQTRVHQPSLASNRHQCWCFKYPGWWRRSCETHGVLATDRTGSTNRIRICTF